jgi:hypothetical protein
MNKTIVLVFIFMFILNLINAERFGICSCFNTKNDEKCCKIVKGNIDGNVCEVSNPKKYVKKYEECCSKINGKSKCKPGYRN